MRMIWKRMFKTDSPTRFSICWWCSGVKKTMSNEKWLTYVKSWNTDQVRWEGDCDEEYCVKELFWMVTWRRRRWFTRRRHGNCVVARLYTPTVQQELDEDDDANVFSWTVGFRCNENPYIKNQPHTLLTRNNYECSLAWDIIMTRNLAVLSCNSSWFWFLPGKQLLLPSSPVSW